jgi:hypothetical protein
MKIKIILGFVFILALFILIWRILTGKNLQSEPKINQIDMTQPEIFVLAEENLNPNQTTVPETRADSPAPKIADTYYETNYDITLEAPEFPTLDADEIVKTIDETTETEPEPAPEWTYPFPEPELNHKDEPVVIPESPTLQTISNVIREATSPEPSISTPTRSPAPAPAPAPALPTMTKEEAIQTYQMAPDLLRATLPAPYHLLEENW